MPIQDPAYHREYRRTHRDQIADRTRRWHYARVGITVEDYDRLLREQGGCGICGKPPAGERLMVDHDHETGRVRGLLCRPCNRAIGMLGDSTQGVARAIVYLNKLGGT